MPRPSPAAARLLSRTALGLRTGSMSVADAIAAMRAGGFALVLAVIAAPNLLPSPGVPLGVVLGVPMLVLAAQYAAGAEQPRLPGRLLSHPRLGPLFGRALRWLAPRVRWWERRVRRRPLGCGEACKRWLGGTWIGLMAVLIILPVPFGNTLPALGALLVGLGTFLDDRLTVGLGIVSGLAGLGFVVAVVFGAWELAHFAFWPQPGG